MAQQYDEFFIQKAIEGAVKKRIAEVLEVEIEAVQKRVRQQVGQEIDRIALSIMSDYSVQRMGTDILIRVINKPGASG